jgi:hypothetical protein
MTNELSVQEAAVVKALLAGGYKSQDIAAFYGVNQRAVSQIKNGDCYPGISPNFDHGFNPAEITTPKVKFVIELRRRKRAG